MFALFLFFLPLSMAQSAQCEVGEWTATQCNKLCGGGLQYLSRQVKCSCSDASCVDSCSNENIVKTCGATSMDRPCNESPCVDCSVSMWTEWATCSEPCGLGVASRTRDIGVNAGPGGKSCPPLRDQKECNLGQCAPQCHATEWQKQTDCSKSCGGGIEYWTRQLSCGCADSSNAACVASCKLDNLEKTCGKMTEERSCNTQQCRDCVVEVWSDGGTCSEPEPCGPNGFQRRTR
eukprot:368746_1